MQWPALSTSTLESISPHKCDVLTWDLQCTDTDILETSCVQLFNFLKRTTSAYSQVQSGLSEVVCCETTLLVFFIIYAKTVPPAGTGCSWQIMSIHVLHCTVTFLLYFYQMKSYSCVFLCSLVFLLHLFFMPFYDLYTALEFDFKLN